MLNHSVRTGRHYLQVPGPTPVPERILAAMGRQIIDHRSPEFQELALGISQQLAGVFKTRNPVMIFASSGTGAWESALVNTLSAGDHILIAETGHFGLLWARMARELGLVVQVVENDWRAGPDANLIEEELRRDTQGSIKAVCIVHSETSTGVRASIHDIRHAIDAAGHPALLMVDAISSLAAMDFRHDEWKVDVAVSGSQKGMMLPPGLSFVAVSDRAIAANTSASLPRSYWSWKTMRAANSDGFFPYTPATGLLFGLAESLKMLDEEGLENRFARHERHAETVRRAVSGWGLTTWCRDPGSFSSAVTAVVLPEGHNADSFRAFVREHYDVALAMGLSRLAGKAFRIGHLGATNDVTILAALAAIEMGLVRCGVPHSQGGLAAAIRFLTTEAAADSPAHSHASGNESRLRFVS